MYALAALCVVVSCGGNDGGGGTPPTEFQAPSISCPAAITLQILGEGLALNYPAPTVTNGAPPVNVICSPSAGSTFPVGNSTVQCAATDAQARRAECSFGVTLTASTIGATKFLAFGDSVTQGIDNSTSLRIGRLMAIPTAQSYPGQLLRLLRTNYPSQSFTVENEGVQGMKVSDPEEVARLGNRIQEQRPHALLLMMGYNDLLNADGKLKDPEEAVRAGLREMVIFARSKAVPYIFLGTLIPPGPCPPVNCRHIDAATILHVNAMIAGIANEQGATLVNTHDPFLGREAELIGDGLHPTATGYEVLAQTFYDAIARTVGTTPPGVAATFSSRR